MCVFSKQCGPATARQEYIHANCTIFGDPPRQLEQRSGPDDHRGAGAHGGLGGFLHLQERVRDGRGGRPAVESTERELLEETSKRLRDQENDAATH